MIEGRAEAEAEEAERKRWLASPDAQQQRQASRMEFADISAAEASALLPSLFHEQFAKLEGDPARFLSDAQLVRPLGAEETAATVVAAGDRSLLDAGVPVRAEDERGALRKVDLSLIRTEGGFEPDNPLTALRIPERAVEAVEVGEEGLAIAPEGVATGRSAQLLGESDVYHHEVLKDTGYIVSPISGGVELFNVLYSAESPEGLRYRLELPDGAELRSMGGTGAEVVRGSEALATVPPPTAVDAQGSPVPVEMTIEGATLSLHVPHHSHDLAYPIMVDPVIWENWYTANWFNAQAGTPAGNATLSSLENGAWQFAHNYGFFYASTWPIYRNWGGSSRGLFVSTPSQWLAANTWGRWAYSAPNIHSYISGVSLLPFWVDNHGCSKTNYQQPDDYVGLWGDNQWNQIRYNDSYYQNYSNLNSWGRSFHVGLTMAGVGVQMPCWRDIYVGGAAVYLDDWASPVINWVSGVPSGWFGDATPITVTANVSDWGLGVQFITVTQEDKGVIAQQRPGNCTGLYGSNCPTNHSSPFGFSALSLGEGIRALYVSAQDPTGKGSGSWQGQTMVDRSEPHVTLDGQLARETNEVGSAEKAAGKGDELSLPVYNLNIAATDGNPDGGPKEKRSGVKDIKVFLDNVEKPVPWTPQSCSGPNFSCPMTVNYPLALTGLDAGEHKLAIKVFDHADNMRQRTIEFEYIPATGMKEEFALHRFSLTPDAGPEDSAAPDLAVNVMNGNLVYRETDITVQENTAANLEVERYYNSLLPDSESTEWGEGWTLAQAPELEPEPGANPAEAALRDASGGLDPGVELPTQVGGEAFDPALRATLSKEQGGYELEDETGESLTSVVFNEAGRTEELRTEGEAVVDYDYEGGELAEIALRDPGSASAPTEEPEEAEGEDPPVPAPEPIFDGHFGATGSSQGQLDAPFGVAVDDEGNVWVTDSDNHRVQRFSATGEYLGGFGEGGSGAGEFWEPGGIATDPQGNLYVVDSGNNRVQKFNAEGEFLDQFGKEGTDSGELGYPFDVAVDEQGHVYVADSGNHRIQKFDDEGGYLDQFGGSGNGDGKLDFPMGVAVDPVGDVLVADSYHHRVQKFSPEGEYLDQFGEGGENEGQFWLAVGVDVGPEGRIWVTDAWNGRVQIFNHGGEFLAEFGSEGAGEGQFDLPYAVGLSGDGQRAWIADLANDRVQTWKVPKLESEELGSVPDDDPAVEVDVSGGLVTAIEGEEAGQHIYEHEGDDLVSHDGPEGETTYDYDSKGRMTKVMLPNGAWAEIEYEQSYGRVISVTVDPAGEAGVKTTEFEYKDAIAPSESRRTTVIPEGERRIFYDIGADGAVLKSRNVAEPPTLKLAGTLYDNREKEDALEAGDHWLEAQAYSPEGIVSVDVIANGNILVDELSCALNKSVSECEDQINEWITETGEHSPGHLAVEVVATDRAGQSASERFWVDMPEPPPPLAPGTPVPPTFRQIAEFREEHGLEIVFPVANEVELNERIFGLITAWWNPQTPAGEVARASYNRWGVPLRAADIAELEYREWYLGVNGQMLEDWAEANLSSSYAGYYLDHRSGGRLRLGFTGDQALSLAQIQEALPLAATDRLAIYPQQPQASYGSLKQTEEQVAQAIETNSTVDPLVTTFGLDQRENTVRVGTGNVAATETALDNVLGAAAPVSVYHEPASITQFSGRFRNSGRLRAGDSIFDPNKGRCTAGFGAYQTVGEDVRLFVLTAGHCSKEHFTMYRSPHSGDPFNGDKRRSIGEVTRDAWNLRAFENDFTDTDALAVRLKGTGLIPRKIFTEEGLWVRPATPARVGNEVCFSGQTAQNPAPCGEVVGRESGYREEDGTRVGGYWVEFDRGAFEGDSGGPVWVIGHGGSIGLVKGGVKGKTLVEPLLHPPKMRARSVPGILEDPDLAPLELKTGAPLRR